MQQLRELRTYVSALATIPILIMIANPTVTTSMSGFAPSFPFVFTILMLLLYIFLWGRGYFQRLGPSTELLAESAVLNAPIIYPTVTVFLTNNASDFVGVLLAYLFFGVIASLYQIVLGKRLSATQKIVFFVLGYMLALITYAGSFEGQAIKENFNLIRAFDHISGGLTLLGYVGSTEQLPLSGYVRMAMTIAIPSITFSALAAQVRYTEVNENPSAEAKMVTSLRPAVALLTFGGAMLMLPVLGASRVIQFLPYLVTIVPALGIGIAFLIILRITQEKEE
jgi:hypothetical protein